MGLDSLVTKIETRSKKLPDDEYLVNALNEVIVKEFGGRTPSTYYSPSSLGKCLRNLYYKRNGVEVDPNLEQEVKNCEKAESGTDRHERIQDKLVKLGSEKYDEFNIVWVDVEEFIKNRQLDYLEVVSKDEYEALLLDHRYDLRFKVDGILKINGRYYILEIKTDNPDYWGRRTTPSSWHQLQTDCYSLSLGIKKAMYLYEERKDFQKKGIIKEVKEEKKDEIVEKIEIVEDYVERGELPPKDKTKCKFCKYPVKCARDYNPAGDNN